MKRLTIGAMLFLAVPVQAAVYDINITADNNYGLYTQTVSGLEYIGGDHYWSTVEQYQFDFSAGDYVYVFAWDSGYVEGVLGEFTTEDANFDNFFTSTYSRWEVTLPTLQYHSDSDPIPDVNTLAALLEDAVWDSVVDSKSRSRWGKAFNEIDSTATFIWGGPQDVNGPDTYLFRRQITGTPSPVPEPSTMILFTLGGLVMWWCGARKHRQ